MSARPALMIGLLACTLPAHDAGAQPSAAGAGRISGVVVSASAGSIADATITLTHDAAGNAPHSMTTISDRLGRFAFDSLATGRYRVSATKSGYTNRQILRSPSERFDTGLDVAVRDGSPSSVELTLHREASIAGRVAEPDGIPAPDVQVFAAVRRGREHVLLQETRTVAQWDGRYRITGLPPGEYLVVALPAASGDPNRLLANAERRAPESSSATRPFFDPTFYPGVMSVGAAESVTVFEGIPADGIDIWLEPGERYSISGRVLWPEGVNAENIVIEYANLSAQRSGLWTVPEPGDLFRITGVPPGTVVLLARADSDRGPLAGVVTTEVNVAEIEDLELRLGTPGIVEGRIVYQTTVPPTGRATRIAMKQRLLPVSPLYPVPESPVESDGRFRIEHALGEYEFEIAGLSAGLRVTRVLQHGRTIANGRIRVTSGETLTDLELVVGR